MSIYQNSTDTIGTVVPFSAVIRRIQDGGRELDEKTKHCQKLASTKNDFYRQYKALNLPAVTFSGTFPGGKRQAAHILQHSGFITIDIDNLSLIPDLLACFAQMSEVVLAFVSPSGMGIKVIVSVDPVPANADEHKGAYQACLAFFSNLATEFEFEVDTSGSDCSRLCFLAHDYLAIVHDNPIPITWDRDTYLAKRQEQVQERREKIAAYDELPPDGEALDYIDPDNAEIYDDEDNKIAPYDVWVRVGMACRNSGLGFQVWDAWSQRGAKYKADEMQSKWASFTKASVNSITWGTVVYWARQNGYKTKRPGTRETHKPPPQRKAGRKKYRKRRFQWL